MYKKKKVYINTYIEYYAKKIILSIDFMPKALIPKQNSHVREPFKIDKVRVIEYIFNFS